MVELNLEEQVHKIEQESGMRSESSQSQSEAEAAKAAAAMSGKVFDANSLPEQMPDLVEINEPYELQNQTPVYFKCQRGDYSNFFVRIEKPCVIKVATWPLDDKSDPDLYIDIDSEQVDCNSWLFKSNQIGPDSVIIYPENEKFRCGVWRIAIHAFNNGEEQKLGIKLSIKEAKEITQLTKEMAPLQATVVDSLFFKYTIQDTSDLENMLLLLRVSNRKDL